jgi:hypothetical protein
VRASRSQFAPRPFDERRAADLFAADFFGSPATLAERDDEAFDELIEVCGFFGPNNVRRTEQQIRDAVVNRATAEWTEWHTTAGRPRKENETAMFGRLVSYYLSANGDMRPDALTALQTTALGINYAALFAAGATPAAIAAEARRSRGVLVAAAPRSPRDNLESQAGDAIAHAREARADTGSFSAWSAVFVTACVRGAQIAEGLEAVIPPGRTHVGADELLKAAVAHATYIIEARERRRRTLPRQRGTYHAFTPTERAPVRGDIIVQDRDATTEARVTTLTALRAGRLTHGDIVVEVQPGFAITIGGNLDSNSVRRRRYPLNDQGFLVIDRLLLFTQETDDGVLPALPARTTERLHLHSTARIFGLLSPVEECAAVPGQPYHGGILT